jgi:hypothetical protein
VDLALGCGDVWNMMKHAMAEHHVERVIREREGEGARSAQLLELQSTGDEAGSDAIDRFLRAYSPKNASWSPLNASSSPPSWASRHACIDEKARTACSSIVVRAVARTE